MTWTNWARTETATPVRIESPASTDEVAGLIKSAISDGLAVKAVGSGHSFTGAAVAPGVQMRLDALDRVLEVDPATGLVTVEAGIALHRLNPLLAEHDLAMEILGDIDRQTIAGAISTGTHGSGTEFRSISHQVRALELALADGSVVTCSPTEQPDLFAAARVGLGALGVITKVTLQTVPLFALEVRDAAMPLTEVLDRTHELAGAHDHFEFFWFPWTDTALTRTFTRLPGDASLAPLGWWSREVDDKLITNVGLEALCRVGARYPSRVPTHNRLITRAVSDRTFTDLSFKVFASHRNVRFREGEYAVPRPALVPTLRELKAWIEKHEEFVAFPFEVRYGRSDDMWLSPAHERDVAYIAFHQYHRMPHERFFAACFDILAAAGGRPHWGKMHDMAAADLAERYPRFADFVALRDRLDPNGVFANPYLDRVLGPAGR
ncbi:D-arabinono-1,4-lactone oxidase [Nocardioides humilatus]|uniref:D-arabinono-1,4-lactone oxidase n=1 Tax=Nocardioides humilatus TaxID=2607660 RepID=UPI001FE9A037|nr:D-arabinono-1,4-lactone oxidase [Nocardioides humilatus]